MGIRLIGDAARRFVEQLAAERDASKGNSRFLLGGTVKLDSVKAWDGKDAAVDGSEVEAVYKAYKKPTEKQKKEAATAKAAGLDLQFAKGRVVDVKRQEDGSTLLLVTNGARSTDGKIPYRAFNVNKGRLIGIAIGQSLSLTAEEARALADKLDEEEGSGTGSSGSAVQPGTQSDAPVSRPAPATPAEAVKHGPPAVQGSEGRQTTAPPSSGAQPAPELAKLAEALAEANKTISKLVELVTSLTAARK